MGCLHPLQRCIDLVRHRRHAALVHVDRHDQPFGGRRQIAFLGMVHRLDPVRPLRVAIDQLAGDAQRRPQQQFAMIGDMRVDRHGRETVRLDEVIAHAHRVIGRVEAGIEGQQVIADIHMVIAVDPAGQDLLAEADKRGGNRRIGRDFHGATMPFRPCAGQGGP